jgi:transcriptional regulator with XRE-family HTH domain
MADRELSQSELARRVGVSQASIYRLVAGDAYGSKHIHRIARELGTTPAYLTGETDDPNADAPPEPELTREEADLISNWRQLSVEDRKALDRIMSTMLGPKTVHAPRLIYREAG